MSTDSLDRSGNRVANELSHNGVSSLFRAFHTNHLDYDAYYRIMDHDKAFALARQELADNGTFVSPDPENLNRTHPADPDGLGRMNVVVIVEESFSGSFCGVFGNTKNLTPRFDRLCERGLLFTNAYASGTRTVRGLEAISTSFPPIPSEAIVKRPGNENMAGWGQIMNKNGYHSSFLYGGYGTFDNMNAFFSGNGFAISDRMDIEAPEFTNIWGVSDGDLFTHALKYYDARAGENRPFFSIIMTTSNHRPYTFPKGIPGIPAEGGGRKAGVKYADHALGEFLEQAESHAWFDNTLFVIVADHCARVYGRAEVPVATYHIPLLFYAPGKIPPSNLAWPIGQIDIAPTVLAALGLPYTAPFYGHDIFDQSRDPEKNPLFLNHNHDVAMMVGDTMAVLGLHRSARLFHYDRSNNTQTPLEGDPDTFDRAAAIYQTAYELFREHAYR
jgi:phosphoglycerol transferase MdoB-like AlkP superfamily enzyme